MTAGKAKRQDGDPWPRWMTVETCAAYIDRSIRGIEGLVRRGSIPFVKQGALIYFDRDRIDRWMENGGRRHAAQAQKARGADADVVRAPGSCTHQKVVSAANKTDYD